MHYALNSDGEVVMRAQSDNSSNDPDEVHRYVGGVQVADYTNDNNSELQNYDYQALITDKTSSATGTGRFWHGATAGTSGGEFGTSGYDPINAITAGTSQNSRSSYVVQSGDTLQGIAQNLWGDSSLWYLIADANGLSADAPLAAGQALAIPNKGPSNSSNAGMFRPYDTANAVGDLSPTQAKPPKTNKCGAFGQIFIAAIAIAVTVALTGPLSGAIGAALGSSFAGGVVGGALAGAAGSVVSQGVGLATGIQTGGFSFKDVALAAVSGAVGGGLANSGDRRLNSSQACARLRSRLALGDGAAGAGLLLCDPVLRVAFVAWASSDLEAA